ncbi:hypothetical protein KY285_007229 [Solanum tuberosum]|nr:hypothetical protein KY284_007352 [Solanum tuberosum]KAH0745572.1 hypothetical protein KY285_007229 [Solanum tuberosum]
MKFRRANLGEEWSAICNACEANIEQRVSELSNGTNLPPPSPHIVKLNSDGSCLRGICGGGGVVRDNKGRIICAYSIHLGPGTSNMAKAASMLFGIKWCVNNGHSVIIGETDSLLIIKCVRREWKVPWRILHIINEIQELVEKHGFEIKHCFQEANRSADKLASMSHILSQSCLLLSY